MPFIVLPSLLSASVHNAGANAEIIAEWISTTDVHVDGRYDSEGLHCSMCNVEPRGGTLYQIVQLDTKSSGNPIGVRIGFDVCRNTHLIPALNAKLRIARGAQPPDARVIKRLEEAIMNINADY